jgi:hypothetical protein
VIRDRVRGRANYRERDGKTVSVLVGRKTAVIVSELPRFENSRNVEMKSRRLISSVACSSFAREESNFSFFGLRRRHQLSDSLE